MIYVLIPYVWVLKPFYISLSAYWYPEGGHLELKASDDSNQRNTVWIHKKASAIHMEYGAAWERF